MCESSAVLFLFFCKSDPSRKEKKKQTLTARLPTSGTSGTAMEQGRKKKRALRYREIDRFMIRSFLRRKLLRLDDRWRARTTSTTFLFVVCLLGPEKDLGLHGLEESDFLVLQHCPCFSFTTGRVIGKLSSFTTTWHEDN